LELHCDDDPFATEAAAVRGQQAYQRMQTILSNGIMRAVESGMFERAENSMREHLQNMKVSWVPLFALGTSSEPWAALCR